MFKYLKSSNLVNLQDKILNKSWPLTPTWARGYIDELNKYHYLFDINFMGFNTIPTGNLAIRQYLILAVLNRLTDNYNFLTDISALKHKADILFRKNLDYFNYSEGYSYFLHVKAAYDFFFKNITTQTGSVQSDLLDKIMREYGKIASPEGNVPVNDTSYVHRVDPSIIGKDSVYETDLHTVYRFDNGAYVFLNHNRNILKNRKNGHVEFEYGSFCIYANGEWQVLHKWYPGYSLKKNSPIKESWNNNIINLGLETNQFWWRYLPFQTRLAHVRNVAIPNRHTFFVGDAVRIITVEKDCVTVKDMYGKNSSFNKSKTCLFSFSNAKLTVDTGYHSPDYGRVEKNDRLVLSSHKNSGDRTIYFKF